MKKPFFILLAITIGLVLLAAVTVKQDAIEMSSGSVSTIDTVMIDTSGVFEIGEGAKLPTTLKFFTRIITSIDSVDTVYAIANMDVSWSRTGPWYDYCDIDTMEQDTAVALTTSYLSDAITVPDFRYARIRTVQAIDCSTYTVQYDKLTTY